MGTSTEPLREPPDEHKTGSLGTTNGTIPEPATLELVLVDSLDLSLRSKSRSDKPKRVVQPSLNFDGEQKRIRYAILRAVWERVQPLIARTTTWTDWRKRNSGIAATFALGGFTPEQIVKAWEITKTADGDPVRELFMVQRKLEQISAHRAQRAAQA